MNSTSKISFPQSIDLNRTLGLCPGSQPTGRKKIQFKFGIHEVKSRCRGRYRISNQPDKFTRELLEIECDNMHERPRRTFSSITWKLSEPKVTALIFQTGKINLTGAQNRHEVCDAAAVIKRTLDLRTYPTITYYNFVGSGNLGMEIKMIDAYYTLLDYKPSKSIFWEPELFPGLVAYSLPATIILFRSGKVIITGAKCDTIINQTFVLLQKLFKKQKEPSNL